jgi:hypothetical protein
LVGEPSGLPLCLPRRRFGRGALRAPALPSRVGPPTRPLLRPRTHCGSAERSPTQTLLLYGEPPPGSRLAYPDAALVGEPFGLPLCHRAWGRQPVPCYLHAPTAGAQSAPLPRRCFCTGSPLWAPALPSRVGPPSRPLLRPRTDCGSAERSPTQTLLWYGEPSGLPLCHRAWGRQPVPCYVHAPTAGAQSAPLPRRCFCTGSPPGSRFAIVRGAANPSLATSTHRLRERRALPYPDAALVGEPSGLPLCHRTWGRQPVPCYVHAPTAGAQSAPLPRRCFGRGAPSGLPLCHRAWGRQAVPCYFHAPTSGAQSAPLPRRCFGRGAPSGLPLCHRAWRRHPVPCYVHAPTAGAQSAPLPRRRFGTGSPPGSRFAYPDAALVGEPSGLPLCHRAWGRQAVPCYVHAPTAGAQSAPLPGRCFGRGKPSGLPLCHRAWGRQAVPCYFHAPTAGAQSAPLPRRCFGTGSPLWAPALPSRVGPPTRPLLPPRTDCGSAERSPTQTLLLYGEPPPGSRFAIARGAANPSLATSTHRLRER